jgi:hypothetical protein
MSAPLQPSEIRTLAAARWLASQVKPVPHAVPVLKGRFQLSGLEACQAIALARDMPAKNYAPKQEDGE